MAPRIIQGLTPSVWGAAFALVFACGTPFPSEAQQVHEPQPGSAERRALMDAIRPLVVAQVGPPVEFVVREIRVVEQYAFVAVEPQRPGGRPIDFTHLDDGMMDGLHTEAVLINRSGRWLVVTHSIGSTDVWYVALCGDYPRGLIPHC